MKAVGNSIVLFAGSLLRTQNLILANQVQFFSEHPKEANEKKIYSVFLCFSFLSRKTRPVFCFVLFFFLINNLFFAYTHCVAVRSVPG